MDYEFSKVPSPGNLASSTEFNKPRKHSLFIKSSNSKPTKTLSIKELEAQITSTEQLLKNQILIDSLSDKGEKLRKRLSDLKSTLNSGLVKVKKPSSILSPDQKETDILIANLEKLDLNKPVFKNFNPEYAERLKKRVLTVPISLNEVIKIHEERLRIVQNAHNSLVMFPDHERIDSTNVQFDFTNDGYRENSSSEDDSSEYETDQDDENEPELDDGLIIDVKFK